MDDAQGKAKKVEELNEDMDQLMQETEQIIDQTEKGARLTLQACPDTHLDRPDIVDHDVAHVGKSRSLRIKGLQYDVMERCLGHELKGIGLPVRMANEFRFGQQLGLVGLWSSLPRSSV